MPPSIGGPPSSITMNNGVSANGSSLNKSPALGSGGGGSTALAASSAAAAVAAAAKFSGMLRTSPKPPAQETKIAATTKINPPERKESPIPSNPLLPGLMGSSAKNPLHERLSLDTSASFLSTAQQVPVFNTDFSIVYLLTFSFQYAALVATFGGNLSPFLSGFNSSLLVNTLLGMTTTPPPTNSLLHPSRSNSNESFIDHARSVFPLNLSNNNNNGLKETRSSGSDEDLDKQEEKSSSIADLRMKAKRHQESLGINDSD